MKTNIRSLIAWIVIMLLVSVCGFAFAASLSSESSADDRIFIFDQSSYGAHNQGNNITILHNRYPNGASMSQAGCSLYATMHAYQWVTGDKRTTSNAADLINEFLSCNGTTSMQVQDWKNDNSYTNYLKNKYNVKVETPSMNASSLTAFFDKGGALKVHTPKGTHFVTAIGSVVADADIDNNESSEVWIHIVDSAAYSTFNTAYENISGCRTYTSHTALNKSLLDEHNSAGFTNNRKEDNYAALEYWVPYDTFSDYGIVVGYLPGKNIDSSSPTASTLQFSNVAYPQTFRINTANGWALGSGTLASNYELKTLTSKIVNSSGTVLSSATKTISGYSYSIISLDTYSAADNGVKFSKITTAGNYKWILTATDRAGRSLTLTMPFTASSTGSTSLSTASAVYQEKQATLNIDGWLNDTASDTLEDYGSFDVYINGSQVADDVNDYNAQWPVGSSYEIKDVRANISFGYNGVYSGSLSGIVKDGSNDIVLNFSRPGRTTVRVTPGTDAVETVFNWEAVDTATNYVFRILNSDGYDVFFSDTVESNQLTYSKLLPAGKYWVTVAASNSNNNSWLYSSKVSFNVAEDSTPTFDPDFILPLAMKIIDVEAFEGISATSVKLSEATTTINSKAFANCANLVQIYIPKATVSIASDAFSGVDGLVVYGHNDSYAESYSQKNGYAFVAVE